MQRLIITGATGFVGRHLIQEVCRRLLDYELVAVCRAIPVEQLSGVEYVCVPDIGADTDFSPLLRPGDVVIHTAAHVHVVDPGTEASARAFQRVNVDGSAALARAAVAAGAQRLIFLSSIGVNGVRSHPGQPFTEIDAPNPHNLYAQSKCDAEHVLRAIGANTGLEVVIVRPPLVYGAGVKANFAALTKAVVAGWPLPLASIRNARSLIGVENLVDFLILCGRHPNAANQTFVVSDGEDVSTPELVQRIAHAAGVRAHLFPIPVGWLHGLATVTGRRQDYLRLCGSLQVDIGKARNLLTWIPPVRLDTGLQRAVVSLLPHTISAQRFSGK